MDGRRAVGVAAHFTDLRCVHYKAHFKAHTALHVLSRAQRRSLGLSLSRFRPVEVRRADASARRIALRTGLRARDVLGSTTQYSIQ